MKRKNNQVNPEIISFLEFHTKLSKEQRNQFFKLNLLQKKEISKFAKKSRRKFKKNRH